MDNKFTGAIIVDDPLKQGEVPSKLSTRVKVARFISNINTNINSIKPFKGYKIFNHIINDYLFG